MKKRPDKPVDAGALRLRAEQRLQRRRAAGAAQPTPIDAARLVHELQVHQIELEMQNEELQQERARVETLAARYTELYDFAPVGYFSLDREGVIRQANLHGARLLGLDRSNLMQRRFGLFVAESDRPAFSAFLQKVFAGAGAQSCELGLCKGGDPSLWVRIEATASADGQECRAVVLDLSDAKQAHEAIMMKEHDLAESQRIGHIGSWRGDLSGRGSWSDETYRIFGVSPDTFVPDAGSFFELIHPDDRPAMQAWTAACASGEQPGELTFRRILPDGTVRFISGRGELIVDADKRPLHMAGTAQDITDLRRSEAAQRESQDQYRKLVSEISDGVFITDDRGALMFVNPSLARIHGFEHPDQLVGRNFIEFVAPSSLDEASRHFRQLVEGAQPLVVISVELARPDGVQVFVEVRVTPRRDGGKVVGTQGIVRDVTANRRNLEQQQAAQAATKELLALSERSRRALLSAAEDQEAATRALRDSEQRFRGLVEQSLTGIYISQDGAFVYANPRLEEVLGYGPGELVGVRADDIVIAEDLPVMQAQREKLRAGATTSVYEVRARRRDGALIELGVQGRILESRGALSTIGMAQDITEKKRAEEEIKRYLAQLETAFMSTVNVAMTLSEMRDPYTSGHERRVAEIAMAIGAELGFDQQRLEGLRVAGYLHDVGKITIPSEILSKPGKLSAIEYRLIQGHPQAGYDVLKDVEFPWPVAQVALQHHERLDGGGYPQGLKGEAILLEARIMAVADVVEAMSSHRPYRPGLGIDKALAEIERGRGTAYDAVVADECLELFREKGYAIPA